MDLNYNLLLVCSLMSWGERVLKQWIILIQTMVLEWLMTNCSVGRDGLDICKSIVISLCWHLSTLLVLYHFFNHILFRIGSWRFMRSRTFHRKDLKEIRSALWWKKCLLCIDVDMITILLFLYPVSNFNWMKIAWLC